MSPLARPTDPKTSHDAAASFDPKKLYGIVVDTLRKARTGLTTHEIAHLTGISWGTITPRMKPLRLRGVVFNTGLTRDWYGSPGNPASTRQSIVWQLTALAHIPSTGIPAKPKKARKAA